MPREAKRHVDLKMARRLTEIRQYRNMSLRYLAECIGVTKATICNYEHGRIAIGTVRLEQLASALRCEVADLFAPPGSSPPRIRPSRIGRPPDVVSCA
jgi:transcriptional regulator with XRE-family HTH domain